MKSRYDLVAFFQKEMGDLFFLLAPKEKHAEMKRVMKQSDYMSIAVRWDYGVEGTPPEGPFVLDLSFGNPSMGEFDDCDVVEIPVTPEQARNVETAIRTALCKLYYSQTDEDGDVVGVYPVERFIEGKTVSDLNFGTNGYLNFTCDEDDDREFDYVAYTQQPFAA